MTTKEQRYYEIGLSRLSSYQETDGGRYVLYFDDATSGWYCAPRADVYLLGTMGGPDVYSLWCASTSHEMVTA